MVVGEIKRRENINKYYTGDQNLPKLTIKYQKEIAICQKPRARMFASKIVFVTQKHLGEISNTRYRNSNFANIVVLHFLKINVVN